MTAASAFLVVLAGILLVGTIGELMFRRTGVPDVIWLIVTGILLGPVAGLVERDAMMGIAPLLGAVTLVVVLFDGGLHLRLADLRGALGRALVVAVLGWSAATAVVAAASMGAAWLGWLPETWGWAQAILLGAILGGSSALVIMPAVRTAGLSPPLANLLSLESSLTDVLCVVVATAGIEVALTGAADPSSVGLALGKSLGLGVGVGAVLGLASVPAFRLLRTSGYGYPVMLGALMLLYAGTEALGGSPALAVIAFAVVAGNAADIGKAMGLNESAELGTGLEGFHGQLTFLVKSFFFTFLGLMLGPPWSQIALGVALGLLLIPARFGAVWLGALGSRFSRGERRIAAVAMPRGLAAGVLAMTPLAAGVPGTESLPGIVYAAVFTSILVFAVGFPLARRSLDRPAEAPHLVPAPVGGEVETEIPALEASAAGEVAEEGEVG